jgi:hypothetical protein
MSEFAEDLRTQVVEAQQELRTAQANGEDYDVQVFEGRLEHLRRVAARHGIELPDSAEPRVATVGEGE